MEKKNVNCPFCGYEKQIGADCPKCGRGGVILKVEDVAAGCRYHKPLSEHDSFDSAYEAACKLFDDGTWDDFLIDDGGHLTSLPGYRLVKETCPKCGKEARPFEMYGTRDYYGIPFDDTDGIKVFKPSGAWWLLRASNTMPALLGACEADSAEELAVLTKELFAFEQRLEG